MLSSKTDQSMQHQNRINESVPPAQQTAVSGWKQTAQELFFDSGCSVVQIAAYTGVSRQSVAAYLKGCAGYDAERGRRREASAAARKEYKKAKNREYRAADQSVTAETMRREHDTAAMILSRERYHN